MGRTILIIGLATLLTLCYPCYAENETNTGKDESKIILPTGTPINLIILEQLYSQRNREGDEILFALAEDIVLMDKTYLCAGTPVIGRVVGAKASKSWGRQGTLDVEISVISPLYSMPIHLSSELESGGGSKKAGAIGAALLMPFGLLGGLLGGGSISGSGALIEAGTSITVFTAEEGTIMDIPVEEMRQKVDEWYTNKVITSFLNYRWDKCKPIKEAMASLGYTVDESMIIVQKEENYRYSVAVQISPTQTAEFVFQPFEEPHGGKFITLEAKNELAQKIMQAVK